ncbi:MAG: FMN-binding glutamate synthase family protein [Ostreibacterium sp.]
MGFSEWFVITVQFISIILILGTIIIIGWMYWIDKHQSTSTIRKNYPVIGRLRYKFEHLGEFFRQYFYAMDREEMPFNRAQRNWVYRASKKDVPTTAAFGSTKIISKQGNIIFVNAPFPPLDEDITAAADVIFGPNCEMPYTTNAIINISAMSYGSLSKRAVEALSIGAKQAQVWLNTGEGGLSSYHLSGGCDVIFQIGTAKYGCRDKAGNLSDEKLINIAKKPQIKMFELKLSQGAKPGKGGILPANKVTEEIAEIRGIQAHKASISPNRHTDIHNNQDLLNIINHIRQTTGKPIGFKAVISSPQWLDELFQLIIKNGVETAPDFITVDSGDGGTGAAPTALMDDMGLPLRESLPMLVNKLIEYRLRDRIKVICSGKRINPSEVAIAYCFGADIVNVARGFLFSLGCIQALQCNKNTCPTGITTHNPDLMKGLDIAVKSERVANFVKTMTKEVEMIAHSCGLSEPRQLNRHHARIVTRDETATELLSDVYPYPSDIHQCT